MEMGAEEALNRANFPGAENDRRLRFVFLVTNIALCMLIFCLTVEMCYTLWELYSPPLQDTETLRGWLFIFQCAVYVYVWRQLLNMIEKAQVALIPMSLVFKKALYANRKIHLELAPHIEACTNVVQNTLQHGDGLGGSIRTGGNPQPSPADKDSGSGKGDESDS